MKKIRKPEDIYEKKGVYGDARKFQDAAHRLAKMKQILKTMNLKKATILDIGGGTGYFADQLQHMFPKAEIHSTDISAEAIKEGKKLYKTIIFKVSDAEKVMPYKDNYFDLVISGEHIAHLKDTDTYLSEIRRILKKNGTLMLTTPNLVSWLNRMLMLSGKAPFFSEPLLNTGVPVVTVFGREFPPKHMLPSGHLRLFTIGMIEKALQTNGIKMIQTYGVSSLSNRFIKPIDVLFANIPSLASGIITISKKVSK